MKSTVDTDYEWIEETIEYTNIEKELDNLVYLGREECVEKRAEHLGYKTIDLVATVLFTDEYMFSIGGNALQEGDNTIQLSQGHIPWKYECVLKQLIREYTTDEIASRTSVGEITVRNHAKELGVIGKKHGSWTVESSWEKARTKTIKRDGECVICNMSNKKHNQLYGRDLSVHHIVPKKTFVDKSNAHSLQNLVALCRECHHTVEVTPRELFLSAIGERKIV